MALLVRTECRTFTAAYMVWSSIAKEMRPRRMAGPPMKSRLLAAGLEWNTLTPEQDKRAFHQYHSLMARQGPWQHAVMATHSKGACAQETCEDEGFGDLPSLRDPGLSPFWVTRKLKHFRGFQTAAL